MSQGTLADTSTFEPFAEVVNAPSAHGMQLKAMTKNASMYPKNFIDCKNSPLSYNKQ